MKNLIAPILLLFSLEINAQSFENLEGRLLSLYEAEGRKILLEHEKNLNNKDIILISSTLQYKKTDTDAISTRILTFIDKSTEATREEKLPEVNENISIRDRLKMLRAMSEATKTGEKFDGTYTEYVYKSYIVFLGVSEGLEQVGESTHSQQYQAQP